MSLRFLGLVRANSIAVLRPIPDELPVMRTVLPDRRFSIAAAAEAIVLIKAVFPKSLRVDKLRVVMRDRPKN